MYQKHLWLNGEVITDENLNHMENGIYDAVPKDSIGNAGIIGETYTTICGEQTVTTELHDKDYPWSILEDEPNARSNVNNIYRITFDGTVYVIVPWSWRSEFQIGKGIAFVGNASLWGDVEGYTGENYDVPFLITSGMDDNDEYTSGTYLITEIEGSHTVKVEIINYNFTKIPEILVFGVPHQAVQILTDPEHTSYSGFSMGVNVMKQIRQAFAIGYNNEMDADSAKAFGTGNVMQGIESVAVGNSNNVSGDFSFTFGAKNTISGQYAVSIGRNGTVSGEGASVLGGLYNEASGQYSSSFGGFGNKASGICASAMGNNCVASGTASFAVGVGSKASRVGQFVFGIYNVEDTHGADGSAKGDYIEIVGNGENKNNRSNARTLDWNGNESLAGGITLGKGTADETTITASQLKQLLELINN